MLNIESETLLLKTYEREVTPTPGSQEELLAYLLTDNFLDSLTPILIGNSTQTQRNKLHDIFTILMLDVPILLAATDDYYSENIRLDLRDQLYDNITNAIISGRRFAVVVLERLQEDLRDD